MKKIILISILVILFGSIPLSILSKVFEYIAKGLDYIAQYIDLFGWAGFLR